MSNPSLLPEQEDLLCKLVEAYNRIKPNKSPFDYVPVNTHGRNLVMILHDSCPLGPECEFELVDLKALHEAKYIQITNRDRTGMFQLTCVALEFYNKRRHPDDTSYKTNIPLQVRLDNQGRIEVESEGKVATLHQRPGILFLRLILSLKKEKLGWLHQRDLIGSKIVTENGVDQSISRLRDQLQDFVSPVDIKDFIEASGDGRLRISTPPRLVVCDTASLLQSSDYVVASLAGEFPI